MIGAAWLLLVVTWLGNVGLLFAPAWALQAVCFGAFRELPGWIIVALAVGTIPQAILIPWAWVDCVRRGLGRPAITLWRTLFFLTGFLAVTLYALKYWTGPRPSHPAAGDSG